MRPGSSRPAPNDPSLLAACQRDDYDMVRYKELALHKRKLLNCLRYDGEYYLGCSSPTGTASSWT